MNILAEKSLIGVIFVEPSRFGEIYKEVSVDMFTRGFYREVFKTCEARYNTGKEIESISVLDELKEVYGVDEVAYEFKECTTSCETYNYRQYVKIVKENYRSDQAQKMLSKASVTSTDPNSQISEIIENLSKLMDRDKNQLKSMREIVEENKGAHFAPKNGDVIKTGFSEIDEIIYGLEGGDTICIGARPGIGKSALAMQIGSNVAKQGKKVAMYNLEMTEKQEYQRLLAHYSEMHLTRIRKAESFVKDEEDRFNDANEQLSMLPLYLRSGSVKPSEIKAELMDNDFDLVIIDYLQLLTADKPNANRVIEVGNISRAIKGIARDLDIPVIFLSQLSRACELRPTKEPNLADLRESGDIEQDCSIIMFLWELPDDRGKQGLDKIRGLKIDKNRQGDLGKREIKFKGQHMKFISNDDFVPVPEQEELPFD